MIRFECVHKFIDIGEVLTDESMPEMKQTVGSYGDNYYNSET